MAVARDISEVAKVETGVEIHPGAAIGKRFVVDHGIGTVIGETCTIGDDCYLLQGVVLGSSKISNNKAGKRHPTLGNNVQVGSFSKILGNIVVGNDVVIGAGCLITDNIPAFSKVSVFNEYQITVGGEKPKNRFFVYGCNIVENDKLEIIGENFSKSSILVSIVDDKHKKLENGQNEFVKTVAIEDRRILIELDDFSLIKMHINRGNVSEFRVKLDDINCNYCVIISCFALRRMMYA